MITKTINPTEDIYPATPDYIHGLEIRNTTRQLYVSGTMELVEIIAAD